MAVYDDGANGVPLTERAGQFVNYAGAAVSLGLMVGIGVWGYQLVMRDVTGIPVVRAMEGAMRVAPDNPGGDIAAHRGLAVNELIAVGEAAGPEDRLVLAPATTDLAQEDLDVQPLAEAEEVVPVDPVETATAEPASLTDGDLSQTDKPLTADDMLALADQIAAGAVPLSDLAAGETVAPTLAIDGAEVAAVTIISRSVPGVVTSLRPAVRPAQVANAAEADPVAVAVAAVTQGPAIVNDLPAGTKLVQLGAFPSPESAAAAWVTLTGRFGEYLGDKKQVVQEASSGGQAFYRLRAMGFADLAEARRLCAALDAGGADCIPVVVR